MSLTKHTGPPWRALLAILAVVALAHAAVLETLPTMLQVSAPNVARALTTRSVALQPPAPQSAVDTVVPHPAAPQNVKQFKAPSRKDRSTATASVEVPTAEPEPLPPGTMAVTLPEQVAEPSIADAPVPEAAIEPETVASAATMPASSTAAPIFTLANKFSFPEPARLLYELSGEAKKLAYRARGELLWQQDGEHYDAKLTASMLFLGSRTRTSSGMVTPQGLAPTRFSDKWRSEVAAHFDQTNHRATFSANTPDVELQTAAQDQLSVIVQLAGMLAAEPAKYPIGEVMSFQTVGPKDADIWQFKVEGAETLRVPNGEIETLKLTRSPRKEFDQKVEIWLAPRLNYLPARLKITNANGDFVDQQLRGVEKP